MKSTAKLRILVMLIGFILFLSVIPNNDVSRDNSIINEITIDLDNDDHLKSPKISWYNNSENPIYIDASATGVGAQNWTWARTQPWCSIGDGSWADPYIIENVTIDATGSATGCGIYVNNSKNEYFSIQNCTVFNSDTGTYDAGIKLENTNNGTLIENNCSNNGRFGILLYTSCKNNTLSRNSANDNSAYGIYLRDNCNNNTLSRNNASNIVTADQWNGIYLYYSDNNTLSGNSANDNTNNGIFLIRSSNNTLSGSTASNIIAQNQVYGISLNTDCYNNTISGNTINSTQYGIHMDNLCSNNTISGNNITYSTQQGIFMNNLCINNTISGNTITHTTQIAIYIDNDCNGNTFSGNNLSYNQYGIFLLINCIYNKITENIVANNSLIGVYIIASSYNLVYNNSFLGNALHAQDDNGPNANQWDNGALGNYWDSYTGVDVNDDAIGDTPYTNIVGTGHQDNFPIWDDGLHMIIVNSPNLNDIYSTEAPSFNLSINFPFQNDTWYTIDNGLNNYSFTGNNLTISQSIWNALENGALIIRFYVNNTAGDKTYVEITLIKIVFDQPDDSGEPADDEPPLDVNLFTTIIVFLSIISAVLGIGVIFLLKANKSIHKRIVKDLLR